MPSGLIDPACDRQSDGPIRLRLSTIGCAWAVRKYSGRQYIKPVRQILQYIQSHFTTKISLNDLSGLTGLSRSYLSRLIKKETGSSLVDLVDGVRIEESKYLLRNTDYPILQIAEMVGFDYQSHFNNRFKKYTGSTPSSFRRSV
jgi:AraC-like DNA-binding protein